MSKHVLIINSSPRKGGNSETLAASFAKGAGEVGHKVETIYLREKKYGFCKGCLACLKAGHCVIGDDAVEIAARMHDADVLVFATPVYYYSVSGQLKTMLEEAFPEETYQGTILHSDQGWQYQHTSYHQFLEEHGMRPSMSRKGNSLDNGMMESFFGILKSEMFYGFEKEFQSIGQLKLAIVDYIEYYNNKRIKVKLKGLSPVQYRTQSLA